MSQYLEKDLAHIYFWGHFMFVAENGFHIKRYTNLTVEVPR